MLKKIIKPNGLEIEILKEGEGISPQVGQTVLIHYEIWLGDGATTSEYDYDKKTYVDRIYDNTFDENNPFCGPIEIIIGETTPKDETYIKGQSVEGLDEALLVMKVGGKCKVFIPPVLAYGDEGASSFHTFHGYRTPPNQSILLNIELVDIKDGLKEKQEVKDSGPAYEAL